MPARPVPDDVDGAHHELALTLRHQDSKTEPQLVSGTGLRTPFLPSSAKEELRG
jgi:hypothetical protein